MSGAPLMACGFLVALGGAAAAGVGVAAWDLSLVADGAIAAAVGVGAFAAGRGARY